ncbi:hypothetical protein [Paracoccus albus]|uniref:hypothetical protein n=1 Tax=Paracoccus albus TaxID=3017784 RepID=UPI0022EFF96D|nr:hypothetical protein [Paracoccus albus]WBU60389.1 hypothetical protein PAF20_00180 [Paracoccus albus]
MRRDAAGIGVADSPTIADSIGVDGGMRDTTGPPASTGSDGTTGFDEAVFLGLLAAAAEVALDDLLFLPDVATSFPPEITAVWTFR